MRVFNLFRFSFIVGGILAGRVGQWQSNPNESILTGSEQRMRSGRPRCHSLSMKNRQKGCIGGEQLALDQASTGSSTHADWSVQSQRDNLYKWTSKVFTVWSRG